MNELYKKGFIHRDVKPANVLLKGDIAKLSDFGFCAKIDDLAKRDPLKDPNVGTPLYMSPETLF